MDKHGFTPGPWSVHDHRDMNGNWWIGPGPFDTVAEVRHGHDDIEGDELANARLIAAAPALLEALVRLDQALDFDEPGSDDKPWCMEDWSFLNDAFDAARAAITLATDPGKVGEASS